MNGSHRHHTVRGCESDARQQLAGALPPELMPPVDVHARGGPYVLGATVIRSLAQEALAGQPELVRRHDIELRAAVPALAGRVPVVRETLYSRTPPAERTRIHSRQRTLRIAHGLTEFTRDCLAAAGGGPRSLLVENADLADPTDRQLLTVMLRRLDPRLLTLVVCTGTADGPADGGPAVHGPADGGPQAVLAAFEHAFGHAFHETAAILGRRGRELAARAGDDSLWWRFAGREALSLAVLGRAAEAEELYDQARAASTDPAVHHKAAYDTAMLCTRYHEPGALDYGKARRWVNIAIAIASLLPDPAGRAFHTLFYRNGRALVELRLGNPERALDLVEESLAQLDRELPPGSRGLDRCSLLSNRARVLALLGRREEADQAYQALIAADPDYGEYHFDYGNFLHAAGRDDGALAEYSLAAELSLPFPEVHYNRAQLRHAAGDDDGALADLSYALELDPEFLDAYVNRAGLRTAAGDYRGARQDAEAGLALDPGNAYLTCVTGQLELAAGRTGAALAAFTAALEADPGLAAAWANRATVWYDQGKPDTAAADLTRALALGEDPVLLFNRATAYRAAGRVADALADLTRALRLAPADQDTLSLLAELRGPGGAT